MLINQVSKEIRYKKTSQKVHKSMIPFYTSHPCGRRTRPKCCLRCPWSLGWHHFRRRHCMGSWILPRGHGLWTRHSFIPRPVADFHSISCHPACSAILGKHSSPEVSNRKVSNNAAVLLLATLLQCEVVPDYASAIKNVSSSSTRKHTHTQR